MDEEENQTKRLEIIGLIQPKLKKKARTKTIE
jgi:hypothetical protein